MENNSLSKCINEDIQTVVKKPKPSRSADALKSVNSVVASVSGESTEHARKKTQLAKVLRLSARKTRGGKRIRNDVVETDKRRTV